MGFMGFDELYFMKKELSLLHRLLPSGEGNGRFLTTLLVVF